MQLLLGFLFLVFSTSARGDETGNTALQALIKAHPIQAVEGVVIRLTPTYESGKGKLSYDITQKTFSFNYLSAITQEEMKFTYNPEEGLTGRIKGNDKQIRTLNFYPETTVLSALLSNWTPGAWLSFLDVKTQIKGDAQTFSIRFKQGSFLKEARLNYKDTKFVFADLDCIGEASYRFTSGGEQFDIAPEVISQN